VTTTQPPSPPPLLRALRWLGNKSIGVHKSGWEWMYLHPFTALGVGLAFVVCTRPQVHHIVADLPWPTWVDGNFVQTLWGVVITFGFVAAVSILIFAALAGAILVIPVDAPEAGAASAPPGAWARLVGGAREGRFLSRFADLYPRIDAHFAAPSRRRRCAPPRATKCASIRG